MREIEVDLTRPQSDFFLSDSKYTAAVAGFGSGKTQGALMKIISSMLQYPTMNYSYLAPTYSLIRDIFYPKASELLTSLGWSYAINQGQNYIDIQGLGRIICRTMEKPEMIVGWECGDAHVDEFDVLTKRKAKIAMSKITARCRQKFPDKKKNQIFVTTTPEGFKATYEYFQKSPLPDSRLIRMTTYSNKNNLPDGYIDELKAQYPAQLIDAYLLGKFVNLVSGTVYYAFQRGRNNTKYVPRPKEPIHVGMDFNVYKMAAVIGIVRDRKLYIVDELIDLRDTPAMIESLKENFPDRKIVIYPDASGKSKSSKGSTLSDHKLLRDAGFQIRVDTTNPFVRDRVLSVNNAIDKSNVMINEDNCPFLIEGLEQQVYADDGLPEKDGELDHRNDAIGYLVNKLFPVNKHIVSSRMVGGT